MRYIFSLAGFFLIAQADLVFPWVTNNSQFGGTVIVVNPNTQSANVTMVARRNNGNTATTTKTIPAFGQLVSDAGDLFPSLGDGPGFSIELSSSSDGIRGAFVVSGTASPSGNSPAQANVADSSSASNFLMYAYLPIPSDGGNSAPVVVNMGGSEADITFHGYQNGDEVGTYKVFVPPKRPFAQVTSDMFPGIEGDLYVIAESDQPILGMAFIFNSLTEPSMSNAIPVGGLPELPGSLSLETTSCFILNSLCDWDPAGIPYNRSSTSSVSVAGTNTISHGHFRLTARNQDYQVGDVVATDENGVTTAQIDGLESGQVIEAGEQVTFSILSGLTGGQQAKLKYTIDIDGLGRIFTYTINLVSN